MLMVMYKSKLVIHSGWELGSLIEPRLLLCQGPFFSPLDSIVPDCASIRWETCFISLKLDLVPSCCYVTSHWARYSETTLVLSQHDESYKNCSQKVCHNIDWSLRKQQQQKSFEGKVADNDLYRQVLVARMGICQQSCQCYGLHWITRLKL